jgi:hypothetical protein
MGYQAEMGAKEVDSLDQEMSGAVVNTGDTCSIEEREQMHFSMFEGFYLSDLIYFV